MVDYITDEVKALIGAESEWEEAWDPVERGQIRRHAQATMDDDPVYWDEEAAKKTRYGGVVAPPLFPLHALRVRPDAVDPFARAATDPDFDGSVRGVMKGLPPLPIPLTRVLNGGNDVEIYQLAKPGENIRVKSKYLDIYQKEGRTGTMVFLLTETIYTNQKGELLLKAVQTRIMR
jgi:acyl dehydratase